MSRTYRRKDQKNFSGWFDTEEEFNQHRDSFLKNPTKPVLPPYPSRSKIKTESEYHKQVAAYWDAYSSGESLDYRRAVIFAQRSYGKLNYKDYITANKKWSMSDAGYGSFWNKSIPSKWLNIHCERPLRRKHKQQINKFLKEIDGDVVLENPSPWAGGSTGNSRTALNMRVFCELYSFAVCNVGGS